MQIAFSYLDKSRLEALLPPLFELLYENMLDIAPFEHGHDEEFKRWYENVHPAMQKAPREIVLMNDGVFLAGYFQYYIRSDMLMMEEIQIHPKYRGSGLFRSFFCWLMAQLPQSIQCVQAFSDKRNVRSHEILKHLSLNPISESDGFYRFSGSYLDMRDVMTGDKTIVLKARKRRAEIRNSADSIPIKGTAYYVSNEGNDENDGRSPDRAWKTLGRVNSVIFMPGDGVQFRRGDVFRGFIKAQSGITYSAYGDGEKPRLYGWNKNLADPDLWVLDDQENCIWRYKEKILDTGTLVFNEGEYHSRKLIPSYIGGRFVCRNDENRFFERSAEMSRELDIYWHFDDILTQIPSRGEDFPIPHMDENSYGDLYLKCSKGNPGEVFKSIEPLTRRAMFLVGECENVSVDNLCLKYIGLHAVAAGGHVKGLSVTNCEIGWVGGTIQHYFGTDPNYPSGGRGTVTRFGNAVEIYGGCEDYLVSNCYIYQVYDAGITHQITTNGKTHTLKNIRYLNNLIEKCVYSIEYFLDMTMGDEKSIMRDIIIRGNILRLCGYGWGQQRHNTDTPAHIKGWNYVNRAENFQIFDNIFDRSAYRLLHMCAKEKSSCPNLKKNDYIQYGGGLLGQYGAVSESAPEMLSFSEENVRTSLGDKEAVVITL